nr:discoidin domain-containing protein [Ktedonobacter racemifer]
MLASPLFTSISQVHAAATLLSLNQPATASSTESAGTPASAAVDGNTGTRWGSAFSDPQWLQVDLGATASISQVVLNWESAYARAYQIQVSSDGTNWSSIYSTTTGAGGTETLNISGTGRYVRMYGTQRATGYGYSLWEFQVYGTIQGTGCGTTNAALNKSATASSIQSSDLAASNAVDGNTGTRWGSASSDPQWLQVDLGSSQSICKVVLQWEAAYGKAYQIQVSNDASTWTNIYSTTTGAGGTETSTSLVVDAISVCMGRSAGLAMATRSGSSRSIPVAPLPRQRPLRRSLRAGPPSGAPISLARLVVPPPRTTGPWILGRAIQAARLTGAPARSRR